MPDNLRARIEAALAPHTHNGHLVDAELTDVVEAVTVVAEDTITFLLDAERDHPMIGICRYCRMPDGTAHGIACPEYVGPVWHFLIQAREGRAGGTWWRCACGRSWWGGGTCPNLTEKWRGPEPEDAP